MITLFCDFYRLSEIETNRDTMVVSSLQDYIPLRQHVRRALDRESGNYVVYVQHSIVAQWLKDLRDYGEHVVKWVEVDPQRCFEQRFGFLPPKELSVAAIKDLLHTLPPTDGKTITDPVGWILHYRLDPIWKNAKPDQEHLVNLAAWILHMHVMPAPFQPLVRARLKQWARYDDRYQVFLASSLTDAATSIFIRWHYGASEERRPRGWTHGGATHEEVVVSAIEMQPSQIDFIEPVVTLTGSLQLRKKGTLNITIGNANIFPLKILKLTVAGSMVETRWDSVDANASFTIDVEIPAVNSQEKTYSVSWSLTCEGVGQRKESAGCVDVPLRRLQVSEVDKMFEDML